MANTYCFYSNVFVVHEMWNRPHLRTRVYIAIQEALASGSSLVLVLDKNIPCSPEHGDNEHAVKVVNFAMCTRPF